MTLNDSMYSSERMDWETPHDLFAVLDAEFHFILDPCCTYETAKCALHYTPENDGLTLPWIGPVFMNPPYGGEIKHWMRKAHDECAKGVTVVCLVPARVDTKWWHQWAMRSSEVRLTTRRLTFHGAGNKAPFPVAIVIFRPGHAGPPALTQQHT